jgi:hypothetical protein
LGDSFAELSFNILAADLKNSRDKTIDDLIIYLNVRLKPRVSVEDAKLAEQETDEKK